MVYGALLVRAAPRSRGDTTPHHTLRTEDGRAKWFTQAPKSSVIRPDPQNAITHRPGLDSRCNVTYIT